MTDTLRRVLGSRAVIRIIDPGNTQPCDHCGLLVKYRARAKTKRIIANVYVDGEWDRVEHFHVDCYEAIGQPYGKAMA